MINVYFSLSYWIYLPQTWIIIGILGILLELTDGTYIAETVAIAAYLEDAESTNGMPRHCPLFFAIRAVRNELPLLPPSTF